MRWRHLHAVEGVGDAFFLRETSGARRALVDRGEVSSIVVLLCSVYIWHAVHVVYLASLLDPGGSCFHADCLSADVAVLVIEDWSHIR